MSVHFHSHILERHGKCSSQSRVSEKTSTSLRTRNETLTFSRYRRASLLERVADGQMNGKWRVSYLVNRPMSDYITKKIPTAILDECFACDNMPVSSSSPPPLLLFPHVVTCVTLMVSQEFDGDYAPKCRHFSHVNERGNQHTIAIVEVVLVEERPYSRERRLPNDGR